MVCPCDACTKTFARVRKLIQAIENRDEALKNLENNLEGEVNAVDEAQTPQKPTLADLTTATEASNLGSPASKKASTNPEIDPALALSDYLLSKFMENVDMARFGSMAQNMSPDAQLHISKNLNTLRSRFAEFVKKFTMLGDGGEKKIVITKEDVCQFFEEVNKERLESLSRQLSGNPGT